MARILLLEDDADFGDFLAVGLRRNGHDVTIASSGLYVMREVRKADFGTAFDVIITDILMPEVDGLEVIRLVRRAHPGYKIIAMSAGGRVNGSDVYLHLAEVFGVETALAKPFGIPEICDAVDERMRAA